MHGNFSQDTFHREHHFSRVLMQQGRVLFDADWNEQTAIILHYLRTLAADLIGPHGGPGDGFKITCDSSRPHDFIIGRGHYYVDGILCENNLPGSNPTPLTYHKPAHNILTHNILTHNILTHNTLTHNTLTHNTLTHNTYNALTYNTQPDYPLAEDDEAKLESNTAYFVYLDVWERHLTHLQADHIRKVALGGPDTATRARIVCQVRVVKEPAVSNGTAGPNGTPDAATCADLLHQVVKDRRGCLRARARVEAPCTDPCIIPPEARYRGAENQLYRVEIHDGGEGGMAQDGATFTWSRDNGSVIFGIRALQGSTVALDSLGPDGYASLTEGDWVEIVDDHSALRFAPHPLMQVAAVDRVGYTVTLAVPDGTELPVFDEHSTRYPILRRWDQGCDALAVQEGKWIDLEDGVQVFFEPGGTYQTGDYWLIPARTAIGDVLWPAQQGPHGGTEPQSLPPHGIEHHYAPLARISLSAEGIVSCHADCRCTFNHAETTFNQIFFEENSAQLTKDAGNRLQEEAKLLKGRIGANPNQRVEIRGFASLNEDNPDQLAQERTNSVRKVYLDGGIAATRLSAVGRGAADPTNVGEDQRRRAETVLVSGCAARPSVRNPVRDIEGVGDTFARRLAAADITNAAEVARLTPAELVEILTPPEGRAIPESTAASIIENARRLI